MNAREIYVGELATQPGHALHKFELSIRKGKTRSRRVHEVLIFV